MMTSADIRKAFLDFFASKGHEIVPSAPIVVKNDPTLKFTNAGMNQFKEYLLGNEKPPYSRVADTQKCLRVEGKHDDLEEVGVDTYHHTMFEMLGNWSFGDYFKKEAIQWSWELLTEVYKLEKDRLYVTVFEGDASEGLTKDDEAYNEWKKYIAEDRILMGNKKDNFWEMGDTGPCGPCSEIHVDCRPDDQRKKVDGKTLVNNDDPQVIEIWNNVFMQFNRVWSNKKAFDEWSAANPSPEKAVRGKKVVEFTKLESLPQKHVDTGMGLERLVRVIQRKTSNYDTDIFSDTIQEVEKLTGKKYSYSDSKQNIAFRVIADHIRAISFTIADGQLPSNTGAGYVIRRILRRGVRYAYSYLGYKKPLLSQLVPILAKQFEYIFPEVQKQVDFVAKVVREEEENFLRTLEKGLLRVEMFMSLEALKKFEEGKKEAFILPGKVAFELYDTFGFPIDLTKLIASEKGLFVDEDGFQIEMQQQKNRSRAATTIDAGNWISFDETPGLSGYATRRTYTDPETKCEYPFYMKSDGSLETNIRRYRKVNQKGSTFYQVVLGQNDFYAEGGGQVGDTGVLIINDEHKVEVVDTKIENGLPVLYVKSLPENLGKNNRVKAKIDLNREKKIAANHSATHLLHAALRNVLGTHVAQKGSLVNDEYLRFDFSHFAKVTDEELAKVEAIVNEKIRENIPVVIKQLPKDEAMKLGAMALFGEKYGDVVRVVIIDPSYSVELCGGTHVGSTGEIGYFKFTAETAVAAGVRRVEAVTGKQAENFINEQLNLLRQVKESLKNPKDLQKAIDNLGEENSELKKKLDHAENRMLVGVRNELLQKDEIINGVNFIGDIVEVGNADALKKLCLDLKNHLRDHVAVLCANIGGKPYVAVSMSETVTVAKNLDAGKIIKEHVAPLIKGGGGGQKTLATAGGQEAGSLKDVIAKVKALIV